MSNPLLSDYSLFVEFTSCAGVAIRFPEEQHYEEVEEVGLTQHFATRSVGRGQEVFASKDR